MENLVNLGCPVPRIWHKSLTEVQNCCNPVIISKVQTHGKTNHSTKYGAGTWSIVAHEALTSLRGWWKYNKMTGRTKVVPTMTPQASSPIHITLLSVCFCIRTRKDGKADTELWPWSRLSKKGICTGMKTTKISTKHQWGSEGYGVNTLRPRQNGRHFADDIFKCIFLNENVWIPIKISMKFVPKGPINNIPPLVQIMAWRRPGDKPLSEPMMVSLMTHICLTWPQWVYTLRPTHNDNIW